MDLRNSSGNLFALRPVCWTVCLRMENKVLRTTFLLLAAVSLSGCLSGNEVREEYGKNQFIDLQGGQLELKTAIQVPAERARVFLQNGEVGGGVDDYQPQCNFEIHSVLHQGVTIAPDVFEIARVQQVLAPVVLAQPIRVADGMDGDGPSALFAGYHLWLNSPLQPEVMRLTCYGTFAEPGPDLQPPTVKEIRKVLGSLAELRYPN